MLSWRKCRYGPGYDVINYYTGEIVAEVPTEEEAEAYLQEAESHDRNQNFYAPPPGAIVLLDEGEL